MTSVSTSRRQGLNSSAAIKVPCRVATTAAITLSGLQTIDGVVLASGDRVLVKDQASSAANGIYVVDTGNWSRDLDFDGAYDVVNGTIVLINEGTNNGTTVWEAVATDPVTVGTTAITFTQGLFSGLATTSFLAAGVGAVARSMQSKERDIVSVKDFGVVGNNTDETTKIQAAADALTNGGILFFPTPTSNYLSTAAIVPLANTHAQGAKCPWSNLTTNFFEIDSIEQIEISGFRFTGNNAIVSGTQRQYVLKADDITAPCSHIHLHDNDLSECMLFYNWTSSHATDGVGLYYLQFYRTASKVPQDIRIHDNHAKTTLGAVPAADQYFISIQIGRHMSIRGNTLNGYYYAILSGAGEGTARTPVAPDVVSNFDTTQDRYSGDSAVVGNVCTGSGAGIVVISSENTSVVGNTLNGFKVENLDAEDSMNVVFSGNTLKGAGMAFTVFHNCANIKFDSNVVTLATAASLGTTAYAILGQVAAQYAASGEVIVSNNIIKAADGETAYCGFSNGQKQWKVTGNTLTNIVGLSSFIHNGFIFDDNTVIYQFDPLLNGVPITYYWFTGYPRNYTYNDPDLVPQISFCRNRVMTHDAADLAGRFLQIQSAANQSTALYKIRGNTINGVACEIIARDLTATAAGKRTIFFEDNISKTTPTYPSPIRYSAHLPSTDNVDRVFYRNNRDHDGNDSMRIDAATQRPISTTAGSSHWAATQETPFELGSEIMVLNPVVGRTPGWVCVAAGAVSTQVSSGTGIWAQMAILAATT